MNYGTLTMLSCNINQIIKANIVAKVTSIVENVLVNVIEMSMGLFM
jgi:hypothetical protein